MMNQELKKLAVEIFEGRVFTNRHCNEHELTSVFMPLVFGAFENKTKNERDDIGLIYEYVDKAMPMAINGKPTFASMRYLDKRKTEVMFKYYDKYKALQNEFTKEDPHSNAKQGTLEF